MVFKLFCSYNKIKLEMGVMQENQSSLFLFINKSYVKKSLNNLAVHKILKRYTCFK